MDVKIMVHIEVTSWYPLIKNQEVGDKYNELVQEPGIPSSVKSFKIYSRASRKGIVTRAYLEVEIEKLGAAFVDLAQFMNGFAEIEGYSFEYRLTQSLEEILAAQQAQQD